MIASQLIDGVFRRPIKHDEILDRNTFYASRLVKMTAKQYAYLASHRKSMDVSIRMMLGNGVANQVLMGQQTEMGGHQKIGIYHDTDVMVAWSADAVLTTPDHRVCFVEHKFWGGEITDRDVRTAANQCLFYLALGRRQGDLVCQFSRDGQGGVYHPDWTNDPVMCVIFTTAEAIYTYEAVVPVSLTDHAYTFYREKARAIWKCVREGNWAAVTLHDKQYRDTESTMFFPDLSLSKFEVVKGAAA